MADFAPVVPSGEFDQTMLSDIQLVLPRGEHGETYVSFFILDHSFPYVKIRRHPQNLKYITYCIADREGSNHSPR